MPKKSCIPLLKIFCAGGAGKSKVKPHAFLCARHIINNMIADFHNDILTAMKDPDLSLTAGASACVCAVYGGGRTFGQVRALVEKFFRERSEGLYLSLEDASWLDDDNIDEVCRWRPVCVSLTHNGQNALAGGCLSEGSLSARGKRMALALAAAGIPVDCAHLNPQSMAQVSELVPVVDSHTCFYAVNAHPRNLMDWQIQSILSAGGLVGVTFVGKFLCQGTASSRDIFRHVDHAVQKYGADGICFGSDFYGTDDLPADLKNYEQAENLQGLFLRAGYTPADVEKIFRGNLQNFLAKNRR